MRDKWLDNKKLSFDPVTTRLHVHGLVRVYNPAARFPGRPVACMAADSACICMAGGWHVMASAAQGPHNARLLKTRVSQHPQLGLPKLEHSELGILDHADSSGPS